MTCRLSTWPAYFRRLASLVGRAQRRSLDEMLDALEKAETGGKEEEMSQDDRARATSVGALADDHAVSRGWKRVEVEGGREGGASCSGSAWRKDVMLSSKVNRSGCGLPRSEFRTIRTCRVERGSDRMAGRQDGVSAVVRPTALCACACAGWVCTHRRTVWSVSAWASSCLRAREEGTTPPHSPGRTSRRVLHCAAFIHVPIRRMPLPHKEHGHV